MMLKFCGTFCTNVNMVPTLTANVTSWRLTEARRPKNLKTDEMIKEKKENLFSSLAFLILDTFSSSGFKENPKNILKNQ